MLVHQHLSPRPWLWPPAASLHLLLPPVEGSLRQPTSLFCSKASMAVTSLSKSPSPHHGPQGPAPSAVVISLSSPLPFLPSSSLPYSTADTLAFLLFQKCPSMFLPHSLCTCQFPGLGTFLSDIIFSSTPSGVGSNVTSSMKTS